MNLPRIKKKQNSIEARKTLTGKSIILTVCDEFGNQASKLLTTKSVRKLITKLKIKFILIWNFYLLMLLLKAI